MIIRPETNEDINQIRELNERVFPNDTESKLVDTLRQKCFSIISYVAKSKGLILGHILFSPAELKPGETDMKIAGLAPMAVQPEHQRQGIGTKLIQAGLEHLQKEGYDAVVVLGHPEYYPRFGFTPSSQFGIKSTYDVPDNVFMIKELTPGALKECQGVIHYHPIFKQF